jgi:hypothetical protein
MKNVFKSHMLLFSFVLIVTSFFSPQTSRASTLDKDAKTSPPPTLMTTQGFFDPSFTYLDRGDSSIVDSGNQVAHISVTTYAKQSVASIGVTIYLERWTGSAWVQVGTCPLSTSNSDHYSGYADMGIVTGYYYRARTIHWTSNSGVYEQGERLTTTILAK